MRLVVDANVVIAAFVHDSIVRRIVTLSFLDLFVPELLHVEILRHLPLLRRRTGLSEPAALELLGLLEGYLTTIPTAESLPYWKRASAAIGHVDPRDIAYVAAALAVRADGIWSDDAHLKAQRATPSWTTQELVAALRAQGLRL